MTTQELNQQLEASLAVEEGKIVTIDRRSAALQTASTDPVDPIMALMSKFASTDSVSPEKAKMLLDIYVDGQRRMQEMQDERAFRSAMADFHAEPEVVRIVKDKKNAQYKNAAGEGSPYASLGKEASVIVPLLAKHRISNSWGKLRQTDKSVTLSCGLSYGLFKDEPVEITLPIDSSGAKNGPQQIKSSITYARIITLECACGVAPVDSLASLNDDANAMGAVGEQPETIPESVVEEYVTSLKEAPDLASLQSTFSDCWTKAKKLHDSRAKEKFRKAYEGRKADLQ